MCETRARQRPLAVTFLLSALLAGCTGTPDCPDGSVLLGDRCTTSDAGPRDSSPADAGASDAAGDADAGPCGMTCPVATPVCNETNGTCVGCLGAGDCAAPTALCNTTTNLCVACLADTDCTDPTMARCDAGACVGCDNSSQCVGIAGLGVCDTASSSCVECAGTTDCTGTDTCDLLAQACVDVEALSLDACQACTNDEQCPALHRCVPMQFMSVDRDPAYYCLLELDAPGSCPEPFTVGTPERESLNGAAMERYCAIEEDTVTCEAVRGLLDNWRCDTGVDGRCYPPGEPGMAIDIGGARCENLDSGAVLDRCTYSCGGVTNCPPTAPLNTCGDNTGTAPPNYCGG